MTRLKGEGIFIAIVLYAALSSQSATPAQSTPTAAPTYVGCFSSSKPLIKQDTYQYQSSGHCWGVCSAIGKPVLGLSNGVLCWCGDEIPSADSEVNKSNCSTPCQGYDLEDCGGGTKYFTVWLSGTESTVPHYDGSKEAPSSSSSSSSTSTATTTLPTKSTTSPDSPSAIANPGSTSSSAASLANKKLQRIRSHDQQRTVLGVVLGLTAFTAVVITALALWYCIWRPRKRARRSFRSDKACSLAGAPLTGSGDVASIDSASTYSSQRSHGFVERTGHAIAALQVALNPYARAGPNRLSSSHEAPIALPGSRGNERSASPEFHGQIRSHEGEWAARDSLAPISPMMSVPPTNGNGPFKQPKAMAVQVSTNELISPTSPRSSGATQNLKRSVVTHYPSWSEVNEFDFSGDVDDPSVGNQRGSWHSWRERKDGRYELA